MGDFQIGKLQAALANATNEVTVAAANINFDFCLVKYEAPKEYHPIGDLLSKSRKQDAEGGKSHVTARRLAALFQDVCPDTPELIKAYGERVSEISKTVTSQESTQFASSMFASYAGIDATSIWAAATSSKTDKGGALHVHLLASLFAKIWPPPEAVSIWDELVRERRRIVAEHLEKGDALPFSLATAAAQQEITRTQLSEWDASARAWLQTADRVMKKQQTQLRLILDNIQLSMDQGTSLYASVIKVWIKALTVMERLVSGVPQEVHDGAALLGLAAWHIYPDMHVFGARNIEILMEDRLVKPGGILSLGCSHSATTPSSGVTWSLSLSQLKFYGQPVKSQGSVQTEPTRLSFDELMQVTLGRVVKLWDIPWDKLPILASILSKMVTNMERGPVLEPKLLGGLKFLANAGNDYVQNPTIVAPFVNLGINRPKLIPEKFGSKRFMSTRRLFGYLSDSKFLSLLRNTEARVQYLRRIGARHLNDHTAARDCIIQYFDIKDRPAWATVFPTEASTDSIHPRKGARSHMRWNALRPDECPTEIHYRGTRGRRTYFTLDDIFIYKVNGKNKTQLTYWYGEKDLAAIYVKNETAAPAISAPNIELEDLLWACENDLLRGEIPLDTVSGTLLALYNAHRLVFGQMREPLIQLRALSQPLIEADWTSHTACVNHGSEGLSPPGDSLRLTMSIISYFIAKCNIKPDDIPSNICGISMGDSIYVPAKVWLLIPTFDTTADFTKLLRDPFEVCDDGAVTRILGNIGRPGFVMFSSVDEPVVSPANEESWKVINRNTFDGKPENAFASTSLHLSFTNWERSIAERGSEGIQDVQLLRMESIVSIRDAGRWVGDVDIVRALRDERISRLQPQTPCAHPRDVPVDMQMLSVESWDELRDCHSGNIVVRAHGNPFARLAIAAFLSQEAVRGELEIENIVLCPEQKKRCDGEASIWVKAQ